jgi:hypothetical protein
MIANTSVRPGPLDDVRGCGVPDGLPSADDVRRGRSSGLKFLRDMREGRDRRVLRETAGKVLAQWQSEPELTLNGAVSYALPPAMQLATPGSPVWELYRELERLIAPYGLSDYPSDELRELLLDISEGRGRPSTECVRCGRTPPPDRISAGWMDLETLMANGPDLPAHPEAIQREYEHFADKAATGVMCSDCVDAIELATGAE